MSSKCRLLVKGVLLYRLLLGQPLTTIRLEVLGHGGRPRLEDILFSPGHLANCRHQSAAAIASPATLSNLMRAGPRSETPFRSDPSRTTLSRHRYRHYCSMICGRRLITLLVCLMYSLYGSRPEGPCNNFLPFRSCCLYHHVNTCFLPEGCPTLTASSVSCLNHAQRDILCTLLIGMPRNTRLIGTAPEEKALNFFAITSSSSYNVHILSPHTRDS